MKPVPGSTPQVGEAVATASSERRLPVAFETLLAVLRRRGFAIGVDHHLRLARLLEQLEDGCHPHELGELLCPIFATDEQQQRLFHRLFDELHPGLRAVAPQPVIPVPAPPPSPIPSRRRPRRWPFLLGALALLLALFAAGLPLAYHLQTPAPGRPRAIPSIPSTSAAQKISPTPAVDEPRLPEARRKALATSTRWTLLALPWIVAALYGLYRRRHARMALRRAEGRTPPFVWPLSVDGPLERPFATDRLRDASRALRRRQAGAARHLDVPASVRATVAAQGRVELRYRSSTRVPEYLLLIDRQSAGDHRAGFADELARALETEDLFVHRFFFEGDPRHCLDRRGRPVALSELFDRYGEDRLLLWSEGSQLLDPLTGRLAEWAEALQGWHERAIFTPVAPSEWGGRELQLAGAFVLLPGTLEGVAAAVEHFDAAALPRAEPGPGRAEAFDPKASPAALSVALRRSLGDPVFHWLCACAVHPDLQWDLTLYLASLPSLGGGLLREDRLLRLLRLPWFRSGRLPGELRWQLIRELPEEIETEVREELRRLLERDPPAAGSVAGEGRSLQLALHRSWLHRRDRGKSRRALRPLFELPSSRWRRDPVALRLVETLRPSRLDLLVPRRLHSVLYRDGLAVRGLRSVLLLPVALLISAGIWWALPAPPAAEREAVTVAARPTFLPDRPLDLPTEPPSPAPSETTMLSSALQEEAIPAEGEQPVDLDLPPLELAAARVDPAPLPVEPPSFEPIVRTSEPADESVPIPAHETEPASPPLTETTARPEVMSVQIPWRPREGSERLEVPVELYRRPIDLTSVLLRVRRDLFGRASVHCIVQLGNAGGSGFSATLTVELLGRNGEQIVEGRKQEYLSEGSQRMRMSWPLKDDKLAEIEGANVKVELDYDPSPLRRLIDRLKGPDTQDVPLLDPEAISVEPDRVVLALPIDLGAARLDLLVRPLDFLSVQVTREDRYVNVLLTAANPSGKDQRLFVEAKVLDEEGAVLSQELDRTMVDEGERSKEVWIRRRLKPNQVARASSVRLDLTWQPD